VDLNHNVFTTPQATSEDVCYDKETLGRTDVSLMKKLSRGYHQEFTPERISVTIVKNNVFVGHLTPADLSILTDFYGFKDQLDIVSKCFVTLGKPIQYGDSRIIIRDTMLLAPGGQKSLSSIGKLYKVQKLELTYDEIQNMDRLKIENPNKFIEYGLRDAIITLTHAC